MIRMKIIHIYSNFTFQLFSIKHSLIFLLLLLLIVSSSTDDKKYYLCVLLNIVTIVLGYLNCWLYEMHLFWMRSVRRKIEKIKEKKC